MTDDDRKTLENYGVVLTGDPIKDLFAVCSRVVERGEWNKFHLYAYEYWYGSLTIQVLLETGECDFTAWLSCYGCPDLIPERMRMAAKFIGGRCEQ